MSADIIYMNDTNKICTVEEFVNAYVDFEDKENFDFKWYYSDLYVPIEELMTRAYKIIDICNKDIKTGKIMVNTMSARILTALNCFDMFTKIKIDFGNAIKEYDMLKKYDLFSVFEGKCEEYRYKVDEFMRVYYGVENDWETNNMSLGVMLNNNIKDLIEILRPVLDLINGELDELQLKVKKDLGENEEKKEE